jgi:DNA sulfur modification protein DndB
MPSGTLCVLRGCDVGQTTRSVADGIPTEDRGNEGERRAVAIREESHQSESFPRRDTSWRVAEEWSMAGFELHLPAIRGTQAGREYFLVMCPLGLLPRLFRSEDEDVQPELQAQRVLNRGRVPEIARYITDNPESYVLSSIVGSVDREVHFEPVAGPPGAAGMGTLGLPRAAVETALRLKPELADETVSLVLYVDPGFQRSEQIFSDLKRHESRSSRSQGILCDNRDEMALITKELIKRVDAFDGMTEMVRSKISNRSLKLFTLSGIYHATEILLSQKQKAPFAEKLAMSTQFWTEVSDRIPDWSRAKRREISPAELRATRVHSHAIALSALARAGRALLEIDRPQWRARLAPLRKLDWSRSNRQLWEGRAMIAGRLSKSNVNVLLTGNVIKRQLRLSLADEEQEAEDRLRAQGAG